MRSHEFRSLRERVADTRWRRAVAARRAAHHTYRLVVGIIGALIVVLGIITIPLPGPGWLTVIFGLVVLATEFLWAERLLDFTRRHVHRWTEWVRARPVWVRLCSPSPRRRSSTARSSSSCTSSACPAAAVDPDVAVTTGAGRLVQSTTLGRLAQW